TSSPSVRLAEAYSNHVWSETEHIYETIPESDSEPIYSSPYEHHRHWHGHSSNNHHERPSVVATSQTTTVSSTNANAINVASSTVIQYTQTGQGNQTSAGRWYCSSKSNSSGEEKDSSSAYNTGESCNSNPLTLELQRGEKDHHKSTLVLCPPKISTIHHHQQQQQHQQQLQQQQQQQR
ncbi:AF4/FMR2 family member 4-like, partial [Apis dorsata]|uniref:AF4/FMR2 family member 4-like n=1 Tax=Apis dorsata TaxID=7462 RepID=UPI001293CA35